MQSRVDGILFDSRGREILSDMPTHFNVPIQKRISTLDFHRQRLLEQREMMRQMLEDLRAEDEAETFAEANDFRCEDPLDEEAAYTDFELSDDGLDGLETLAQAEYQRLSAETSRKTVTVPDNASPNEDAK